MIAVKNLSKKFDSRAIAGLHHVSFTLTRGEVMALMGPNGSGKTTLINMLMGKLKPDQGVAEVEGNVSLFPTQEIKEDLNVQKFLISRVSLDIEDEKKIQLARDLADTFEFTFQLRQKLSELSSGQKQKILLAAELINRPALLLMDEPFTHLDPFTRKDILNGLFQYIRQQNMTVLWVTHELDEALRFSDHVGLMNFGKLEQFSTPIELIKKPKNLFVAQFCGYHNFFPVKIQNGETQTPWGKWQQILQTDEAIMVVPDRSWKLDKTSGWKGDILEMHPTQQGITYRIKHEEQIITLVQSPTDQILECGSQVCLTPLWEQCFLIPL